MNHVLRRRALAGMEIAESLYPANLVQKLHTHAPASFTVVLSGRYDESFGGKTQTRLPATILFRPPLESHAVAFDREPVRILNVQLSAEKHSHFRNYSNVFAHRTVRRSSAIAFLGRRLQVEFNDAASSLTIEGLIYELLGEISRFEFKNCCPQWLGQAQAFLNDNFSSALSIQQVATAVGIHPVHLARVFRAKNGCTVGEYVRRLRVEFAARQLTATRTSITEIANAAGFADHSHLTKTFRAYFGVLPSAYRRSYLR
jgi:AraC family transcriptional regulator